MEQRTQTKQTHGQRKVKELDSKPADAGNLFSHSFYFIPPMQMYVILHNEYKFFETINEI